MYGTVVLDFKPPHTSICTRLLNDTSNSDTRLGSLIGTHKDDTLILSLS